MRPALPVLDINDVDLIAAFIIAWLDSKSASPTPPPGAG